ncbi:MAG TPA: NAD-dependent epimerase/dehydratase family protein [Caulobacteraceae bacterium]|jgi:2'-hydroxyisoflavone reductase|nr:NAD-dependent epimerase/dehydratase family protein [Caulobacteraceae bacterium]
MTLAAPAPLYAAPRKPLRILILGGTGFIGPAQVDYALARGHQVTLFNRGRAPHAWPVKVEELIGDRDTADLQALAGREWDVCIDNPTTLPKWVRDAGAALAGRVGQYIFVSTISVYASDATPEADETAAVAAYRGADAMAETQKSVVASGYQLYGPLKALSEAEARRQFDGRATIVRPGLICGPGDQTDRFTYWPVRIARGGVVLAPGNGNDPVQFIDARDLSEWIVRLAERRELGTFNATGPSEALTMGRFVQRVNSAVDGSAQFAWAPQAFLDAHKVSAWSDMPVYVPGSGDTAGFARRSIAKARGADLTFRPLETTAADTLAWFRTLAADRQAKLRAGLTPERETQLLAELRNPNPAA